MFAIHNMAISAYRKIQNASGKNPVDCGPGRNMRMLRFAIKRIAAENEPTATTCCDRDSATVCVASNDLIVA